MNVWISGNLDVTIKLSKIDILFGIPFDEDNFLLSLNFIILNAKWHIYLAKNEGKIPDFDVFLVMLSYAVKVEHMLESLKISDHAMNKWNLLCTCV